MNKLTDELLEKAIDLMKQDLKHMELEVQAEPLSPGRARALTDYTKTLVSIQKNDDQKLEEEAEELSLKTTEELENELIEQAKIVQERRNANK